MKIYYNQNPELLNNFLYYLYCVKNYSITTIKTYSVDLLNFFKFIKEYYKIDINVSDFHIFTFLGINEKDIIAYLVYLNFHKNNSASTRQKKLTSIKKFYKWLIINYPEARYISNPTEKICNIQQIMRYPKYLNLEQAKQIINIFNLKNSLYPIRNNTILQLFLNCGLRISELKNLNINSINFDEKYIKVIGKGNKSRKVFLNKAILNQLKIYLKTRNVNCITDNDPLFINHQHNRLGVDGISDICKKAFKLIGVDDYGYSAHTLRHTSATILYKYVKPDIVLLREYLGHNSVKSTEIYIHTDIDRIKNAINSNPLNKVA